VEKRVQRLRRLMGERQVEALFLSHPVSRRYLTGFTGSAGWVVVTESDQVLISDFRYRSQVREQAPDFRFIEHKGKPFHDVKEVLNAAGVGSVAFEETHLTFAEYRKLKTALHPIELEPMAGMVEKLREVKEKEELEVIRDAAQIADKAFAEIVKELRPGVKERDIALRLEVLMREQGAVSSSFDTIVASGPRSAMPHGVASDRVMEKGDLVTLDFGALYQGYCSDITRTVMLGQPSDRQREIYEIVLEAQKRTVAAIKRGITGKEADRVARDYISQHGYGDAFGHSTGHGLGMEVHERPNLSLRGETPLEPGMVVTVEPGIYLPEVGGVRIEDDVVVTDQGHEVLTKSPKELMIID